MTLACDATGVGRPIIDLLRGAVKPFGTKLLAVIITGSASPSRVGNRWTVPKVDLVGSAQVALQTGRLKVAAALTNAQVLVDELTAFRVRLSENGTDTYGNDMRSSPHDDLVLALAIGLYVADKRVGSRMVHAGIERPVQSDRPPEGIRWMAN